MKKYLFIPILVMFFDISTKFQSTSDLQRITKLKNEDCIEVVKCLSCKQVAEELGKTESWVVINYLVTLWEKPSHEGKGRKVGEMRCGSRAILLEKYKNDYKVQSPLDRSIGWINEIQLRKNFKTTYINWNSKKYCTKDFIMHKINYGESILSISKKYEVSIHEIAAINEINGNTKILVGRELKIPQDRQKKHTLELIEVLRGNPEKRSLSLFEQLSDKNSYSKPAVKSDNGKALVLALFIAGIAILYLVYNFNLSKKNKEPDEKKSNSNFNYENNDKEKNQNDQSTKDEYISDESRYGKILGLEGNVNKKDIHKSYKQKMKEYHPDKVSNMAKELQELALKRTKEINEAYEYFKKKYGE